MSGAVLVKSYPPPAICEKEILRYAGCREADAEMMALLQECMAEVKDRLSYKVCYREFAVTIEDTLCHFGSFTLISKKLAANLQGCERVILFAATIGVEIDRLIARYGRLSPVKALLFQAIGAERIEALCDLFCEELAQEQGIGFKPRFSPGYGDLSLDAQREVFGALDCARQIGLSLTDSLLMTPSKSVTAIVGITESKKEKPHAKCSMCDKKDCTFRGYV